MTRSLALALLLAAGLPAQPVADLAAGARSKGVLGFRIEDQDGRPVPGRLTFVDEAGEVQRLFTRFDADPGRLAVREHVVYTLTGTGRITVPAGRWRIHASKGLEWSIADHLVEIAPGAASKATFRLRREIDTQGWVSGDFHLHTLTHSGHGDADMPERIISIVGEGVEFAVATDHDHHTDYAPTVEELGAGDALTHVTGNEVSTPIGHFNAFPLEPGRPVPDPGATDARALFAFIRAEPNRWGIRPIIQVNHPRWGTIDYFGRLGLDPVTAEPAEERWSWDFDSIEVFNENPGWGWFDAETTTGISVGESRHCVLRDWFHLLNGGYRFRAVGNSDSHHVSSVLAGYPRNFVRSPTDDPGEIDPREIARSIRGGRVFTTFGPFVELGVGGAQMGGETRATDGVVAVTVRIQAASWIDCDRVRVVMNGDVVAEVPVPQVRTQVRLDRRLVLPVERDAWVAVLVEGDEPLAPIVTPQRRPVLPLAVTNPVWVDADGDGRWTSPLEQARRRVAAEAPAGGGLLRALRPEERALTVLAAARRGGPLARRLVRRGLEDPSRSVRLAAARAAELLGEEALVGAVAAACDRAADDGFARAVLLRALGACDADAAGKRVLAALAVGDHALFRRNGSEVEHLLPGGPVRAWRVRGPFRPKGARAALATARGVPILLARAFDPETEPAGEVAAWTSASTDDAGFLDLNRALRKKHEFAAVYAEATLVSPDDREVLFCMGTDDGCRVWLNGDLVLEDTDTHSADPWQHVGRLRLKKGENRLRLKVANATGGFGLHFRLLDDAVTAR